MEKAVKLALTAVIIAIVVVVSVVGYYLMQSQDEAGSLRMATTTSTQDSGLLDYILPVFEEEYNVEVDVIAVGSGQALEMGKRGDVDVLLVHSPASEQTFVAQGYGTNRTQVMYNWFVVVGPSADPADTLHAKNTSDAFQRIYDNGTAGNCTFISRGDNSGTHTKEIGFWTKLGLNASTFDSDWYKSAGQGMGDVLDMCEEMNAYTLSDDATYYSRVSENLIPHINITYAGDSALKNQYSVIAVNSTMWPNVNATMALNFVNWMTSQDGQDVIASYIRYSKQLFTPNAPGYTATSLDVTAVALAELQIAVARQ